MFIPVFSTVMKFNAGMKYNQKLHANSLPGMKNKTFISKYFTPGLNCFRSSWKGKYSLNFQKGGMPHPKDLLWKSYQWLFSRTTHNFPVFIKNEQEYSFIIPCLFITSQKSVGYTILRERIDHFKLVGLKHLAKFKW